MIQRSTPPRRTCDGVKSDQAPLSSPLDIIAKDHLRERDVCAALDRIATAETPERDSLAACIRFLAQDLPLHLRDEEEDLFPLMRRRCSADDNIEAVIARLCSDHDHATIDTPRLVELLQVLQGERRSANPDEREVVRSYATHARRHLILENAIILPLAKKRLSRDDLETLRIRMLQRRGIDPMKEAPDAK